MRSPAVQFVFIVLAALTAFTLGPARTGVRDTVGALFLPVAYPVRKIALNVGDRVSPSVEVDTLSPNAPRSAEALRRQNTLLLGQVSMLRAELDEARRKLAHFKALPPKLSEHVRSAVVLTGPTATRQTLRIAAAGHTLREGMAVVDPKGYVGRVYTISMDGTTAHVLLATDRESRLSAHFKRATVDADGQIEVRDVDLGAIMVEGNGRSLSVPQLTIRQVKDVLAVNDMAVLIDPAYPMLEGMPVGRVSKITMPAKYDGFVEIELTPVTDLAALRDVLIVEK